MPLEMSGACPLRVAPPPPDVPIAQPIIDKFYVPPSGMPVGASPYGDIAHDPVEAVCSRRDFRLLGIRGTNDGMMGCGLIVDE